jgi:tetratricopeptide (TPR) repeat protein
MNHNTYFCTFVSSVLLVSAAALAEQKAAPTNAPTPAANTQAADKQTPPAESPENSGPSAGAQTQPRGQGEAASAPIEGVPSQGSAWISPPPPGPTAGAQLTYPATRIDTASRVEDLLRDAAALRGQGNLSKAMELYNAAMALAPRYAETYRQRALTLLRLGDRVQAQVDYGRFLELDPQARDRTRDEIRLFAQSGYARVGETEVALSTPGSPVVAAPASVLPVGAAIAPPSAAAIGPPLIRPPAAYNPAKESDLRLSIAQDAFARGDYNKAYQWAQRANDAMPQARTHALMAQALMAQGFYGGAAGEARAAVAMAPAVDWTTLYGFYDYKMPEFSAQFRKLEDFVRQNPSSSDARFLLGYEHQILGQVDTAHAQLAISAVLEPVDVTPTSVLARDGVEIVGGREALTKTMEHREGIGLGGMKPEVETTRQMRTAAAPSKTEVK